MPGLLSRVWATELPLDLANRLRNLPPALSVTLRLQQSEEPSPALSPSDCPCIALHQSPQSLSPTPTQSSHGQTWEMRFQVSLSLPYRIRQLISSSSSSPLSCTCTSCSGIMMSSSIQPSETLEPGYPDSPGSSHHSRIIRSQPSLVGPSLADMFFCGWENKACLYASACDPHS